MHSPFANHPETDGPSGTRLRGLLQGASGAAVLLHKLKMLDIEAAHRFAWHRSHFNPDQPRVPAGHPDGGQWTTDGGARNDPRVVSDASPDSDWQPGARYAQSRGGRGLVRIRIGAQLVEVEPDWRPRPGAYSTGIESEIRKADDITAVAEARITELQRVGIGPGPFAREYIPARGPSRRLRVEERATLNRYGKKWGCHTCGTKDPGTASGNFVGDHQGPISWGQPRRIYPQCIACSNVQGGWLRQYRRRR